MNANNYQGGVKHFNANTTVRNQTVSQTQRGDSAKSVGNVRAPTLSHMDKTAQNNTEVSTLRHETGHMPAPGRSNVLKDAHEARGAFESKAFMNSARAEHPKGAQAIPGADTFGRVDIPIDDTKNTRLDFGILEGQLKDNPYAHSII